MAATEVETQINRWLREATGDSRIPRHLVTDLLDLLEDTRRASWYVLRERDQYKRSARTWQVVSGVLVLLNVLAWRLAAQ